MKTEGRGQKAGRKFCIICSIICAFFIVSVCAAAEPANESKPRKSGVSAERPTLTSPDFMPVSEELSPLKNIISVSVKGSTLRDVLYVIAEATGLNLVMEKGVNPDTSVTMTLKNVKAEDALKTIFESVDYFYAIKENMLIVKAVDTRIFEFGQPSVVQDYSLEVGGDVLGGSTSTTSGSSSSTLKGTVTQKMSADQTSFKLWDAIEKSIGNILGSASGSSQAATSGATATSQQATYSVNRMTGTIIVTAGKRDLERVENYLKGVKAVLSRQVIIEARIVEVQLSESLQYGIDWSAMNLKNLGDMTISANNFSNVVTSGSPNVQVSVSKTNFTTLLQALQSQGNVKVISNPRVNIMNGQTALLSVGQNTTFLSGVQTTPGTTTSSGGSTTTTSTTYTTTTSSVLSGMVIGIVPYINDAGDVTLTVTPIVTDVTKFDSYTSPDGNTKLKLPTTDLRELSTTVRIKDGQMVVIGGLIQSKESSADNKIPFLSSIPLLGGLFKSTDNTSKKTELLIMLKPTVVTQ